MPIGARAERVTTRGLEWDLNGGALAFGELVSSSNRFADGARAVGGETSAPLLYTATLTDWPPREADAVARAGTR